MKHFTKRGFTAVELMLIIAILGILSAILIPIFVNEANGMELGKYMPANEAVINDVARALSKDTHTTVTITAYMSTWLTDESDPLFDQIIKVKWALMKKGVPENSIIIGMGNEGGIEFAGETPPAADGVYLILD